MPVKPIKYTWDQDAGVFTPEKIPVRDRIHYQLTKVNNWPWIRKAAVIAAIMRIFPVWAAAFWYDEGVSVIFARLPWDNMIAATAADVHPPGYYIILWLLARTGIPLTEVTARIPSIILSIVAVYLAAILAKKLGLNERGQMIVTAWIVISPLQLHYAQEARMYALLQVEILAAIICILDRRKAILSVFMALAMYTHNYAVFYLPCLALAAAISEGWHVYLGTITGKRKYTYAIPAVLKMFARSWLAWFVIPVLVWIPWFIVLLKQMGAVAAGYWIQPVTPAAVIFAAYQMLFAYSMPQAFQGLAVLVTCGILIYISWRIYYHDKPEYTGLLIIMAAGPLVLSIIASIIWRPVLLFRGLIGISVPLTILIVKVVEGIKLEYKKYYAYAIIGITLLTGTMGHYLYNAESKGLTETWVQEIEDKYENGDVIVSLNDNGIIAVMTYGQDLPLYKLEGCGQDAPGSLSPGTREALQVQEKGIDELINTMYDYNPKIKYSRIWFISTLAPLSPACEIAAAAEILEGGKYRVKLIRELSNTEYTQAGIYLIASKEIY